MHEKLFCDNFICEHNSGIISQKCTAKNTYFVKSAPKKCMTFVRRQEENEDCSIREAMKHNDGHLHKASRCFK